MADPGNHLSEALGRTDDVRGRLAERMCLEPDFSTEIRSDYDRDYHEQNLDHLVFLKPSGIGGPQNEYGNEQSVRGTCLAVPVQNRRTFTGLPVWRWNVRSLVEASREVAWPRVWETSAGGGGI